MGEVPFKGQNCQLHCGIVILCTTGVCGAFSYFMFSDLLLFKISMQLKYADRCKTFVQIRFQSSNVVHHKMTFGHWGLIR